MSEESVRNEKMKEFEGRLKRTFSNYERKVIMAYFKKVDELCEMVAAEKPDLGDV